MADTNEPPTAARGAASDSAAEYADRFDVELLDEYERASLARRAHQARRVVRRLREAAQHLRRPLDVPPPEGSDAPRRENVVAALAAGIVADGRPGLSAEVVRRVVDQACRHYLWSNVSTLPVFHELSVFVPWWTANHLPSRRMRRAVDELVRQMLHGIVLNLERVRRDLLNASEVFLGHCTCRSAGVVDDLEQGGRVFTLLDPASNRLLLDRLLDRHAALGPERLARTTDPGFRTILDRLAGLRAGSSDAYSVENLLRWTYPSWEILPVLPGYTSRWVRSMRNYGKCFPVDRELVFELVNIFYFSKGAIFNSMKCVDSPYTICTCPTPENDGGCVLTNWYYFGGMNHALMPAAEVRRDDAGAVLPCRYFPVRARRSCIGCGCQFESPGASAVHAPRDLARSLAAADEMLAGVR